jgi:hypothetical protein
MKIEERLKFLANSNSNYSLLWAQWEFDKKLLARALNTVSRDFPHYSLHDASHSSTIITQIEKVIAPNIEKLSATDCWLLLESCYWHDAGMIISNDEKKKLLESEDFRGHLEELAQGSHELASHAKSILEGKEQNDIKKALQISNSLTFVIADYFRVLHADRSGWNVSDPTRIKVNSPRTSLIPQRLFNFVAQIVQCHGKHREAILDLAKYNDGMDANDYAHPRYIAALLRIGDLLDIDDGRFCPTLLANIGDVPQSSHDHQHKHASIKHLFINSDVIEIKAECEEYGGYHAQQAWFGYIQDEFDYQKRVWNEIIPDNTYRSLPTIGELSCNLSEYITLDGNVPKINLNTKRVYDYITGAYVYSEKYPFLRELIQNSIDATYYRVWDDLLYDDEYIKLNEIESRDYFISKLKEMNISVNVEPCSLVENLSVYKLKIKDQGVGMNIEDFQKILNVGSKVTSSRNKILRDMPEWATPAGYFGIGLQSVFKLCNEVKIKTKMLDNPCYEMHVINNKKNELFISIKEVEDKRFYGTEVEAYFERLIDDDIDIIDDDENSKSFDVLADNKLGLISLVFSSVINDNFSNCNIQLSLNGKNIEKVKLDDEVNKRTNNVWSTDFKLGVDFNLYIDLDDYLVPEFLYKDVQFSGRRYVAGISGFINIFTKNAGHWLTINRKQGRTDRYVELYELEQDIIKKHHEIIRLNSKDKVAADLYIYSRYAVTEDYLWKGFIVNNDVVLSDCLANNIPMCIVERDYFNSHYDTKLVHNSFVFRLIGQIVKREKISFQTVKNEIMSISEHDRAYDSHNVIFNADGKGNVEIDPDIIMRIYNKRERSGRTAVPCFNKKYFDISVSINQMPKGVNHYYAYSQWVDNFIFMPIAVDDIENELAIIVNFYKKIICLT